LLRRLPLALGGSSVDRALGVPPSDLRDVGMGLLVMLVLPVGDAQEALQEMLVLVLDFDLSEHFMLLQLPCIVALLPQGGVLGVASQLRFESLA